MSFCTPVVSQVARTIFNEANPNIIKLLRAPVSHSRFPLVFRWDYLRPQRGAEGDLSHVHIYLQGLVPFPVRQMVRLELERASTVQRARLVECILNLRDDLSFILVLLSTEARGKIHAHP